MKRCAAEQMDESMVFMNDCDENLKGKIKPGPKWAQRCFAGKFMNVLGRDVDDKAGGCGGMSGAAVRFELPGDCCGSRVRSGWGRWLFSGGQLVATGLAVVGVLLNNAKIRWCFPVWFASNILCLVYHLRAGLWGMAARDVIFMGLAVAGWFQWGS